MNFGELKSTFARKVDSGMSETDRNAYIKNNYRIVLGMYKWNFRKASATATMVEEKNNYSFETDFGVKDVRKVSGVRNTTSRIVYSPVDYESKDEAEESSANEYVIEPDYKSINVYPAYDGDTLKVSYEKDVADLNADSDVPIFHKDYHMAIVHLAAKEYFEEKDRDPGMASYHEEQATKIINELRAFDVRTSYDKPTQFRNIYSANE